MASVLRGWVLAPSLAVVALVAMQLACLSGVLRLWDHSELEPTGGRCTRILKSCQRHLKWSAAFTNMIVKIYCQHHVITENSGYHSSYPANSLRIRKCKIFLLLLWSSLGSSLTQRSCSWERGEWCRCHPRGFNVFCKRLVKRPAWCSVLLKSESPFEWLAPFTCEKTDIAHVLLGHSEQ